MSNDDIRELVQLVIESGIAEIEVQRGENRVRIRRTVGSRHDVTIPHSMMSQPPTMQVGTYYDAPNPGDPPFVKVGDSVEPGQVLCIIESMKLMNEIEAEIAGTVVAKLMENGRPVEYGEALFAIRPR